MEPNLAKSFNLLLQKITNMIMKIWNKDRKLVRRRRKIFSRKMRKEEKEEKEEKTLYERKSIRRQHGETQERKN